MFPIRPHTRRSAFVACITAAALGFAAATPAAAERRTRGSLAIQANPAGLRLEGEASWRRGLYASRSAALRDARVAVGVTHQVTPAYASLRGWVEVAPTSFLDVRAGVEGVGYFGTFGHLAAFPSYASDFGDEARRNRKPDARPRVARRAFIAPAVQLRLGRMALRSEATFEDWRVAGEQPGPYVLEPSRGTLIAAAGQSLFASSTVALVDVSRGRSDALRFGLLHDALSVAGAPGNARRRLGVLGVLKLPGRRFASRDAVLTIGAYDHLRAPDRDGAGGFVSLSIGARQADR